MILTSSSNLVASCSNLATYSISNLSKVYSCDCSLSYILITPGQAGKLSRGGENILRGEFESWAALSASLAFEQGLTWSSWRQGLNRKKRRKLRPNENILSVSHHTSTSDWCQAPKKCPVRLTYAKTRSSSAGKTVAADGWKQVQSRSRGTHARPGSQVQGRKEGHGRLVCPTTTWPRCQVPAPCCRCIARGCA